MVYCRRAQRYPAKRWTAEGITINDVDVSNGAQPVGVIVDGHILIERLPVKPSDAAQTANAEKSNHMMHLGK